MKALAVATVCFAAVCTSAFSAEAGQVISVRLGPSTFAAGDSITVDQVTATSALIAPGDTVAVVGHYRLSSRRVAQLGLSATVPREIATSGGAGRSIEVVAGEGTFSLTMQVKQEGALHVTLYDAVSHKPFGTAYFGTKEQMQKITGMSMADFRR